MPSSERDRLATLQLPALGTEGHTQRVGGIGIELSGPVVLDECVPDRADPVANTEHVQPVAVALEGVAAFELDEAKLVRQACRTPGEARPPARGARTARGR